MSISTVQKMHTFYGWYIYKLDFKIQICAFLNTIKILISNPWCVIVWTWNNEITIGFDGSISVVPKFPALQICEQVFRKNIYEIYIHLLRRLCYNIC
jgi:hypothetical protein